MFRIREKDPSVLNIVSEYYIVFQQQQQQQHNYMNFRAYYSIKLSIHVEHVEHCDVVLLHKISLLIEEHFIDHINIYN